MWFKDYGKTGKKVSVISFGGMRFPKPEDLDASAELVHYAHSKGINYFDTAPYYCNDKSEEIMGRAFKTMKRDTYYVSTKCGEAKADVVQKSLEKSLQRLGVDSIDFFHVWCLVWPHELPERVAGGAVEVLLKAKQQGLIKHVVVSTHLAGEEIAGVLETGYFEGLTVGFNALNFPFRQVGLDAALKRGVGVVTMNPLGGGVIPRNTERLAFLKGPKDKDVVQAALRFNISQPAITSALVGFANNAEVDAAVEAVRDFEAYPLAHIEKVKSQLAASFDGLCTGCGYCLPCPTGMDIPRFMDAYNHKILEGKDEAVLGKLKWHWGLSPEKATECSECGTCEGQCTQRLPIIERLKAIAGMKQPAENGQ